MTYLTRKKLMGIVKPMGSNEDRMGRVLKHAGVKGMKWTKHKSLADQGESGDVQVNGVQADNEAIASLNNALAKTKDPKQRAKINHSLSLYRLDLAASKALVSFREAKDSKQLKKYADILDHFNPNIRKAASKSKYTNREQRAENKRATALKNKQEREAKRAKKQAERKAKEAKAKADAKAAAAEAKRTAKAIRATRAMER